MVDGIVQLIPAAKIGHIGMYRDETTSSQLNISLNCLRILINATYCWLTLCWQLVGQLRMLFLLLKKRGAKHIKLITLVSAPEGVKAVQDAHPDVDIYTGSLDEGLNEHGYIVPGLGDAGDRLFGTM